MDNITFASVGIAAAILIGLYAIYKIISILIINYFGLKLQRLVELQNTDENGVMRIPIKSCPFCGKNISEIFEAPDDSAEEGVLYSMVCDIKHGGCGCSTGAYTTPLGAIRAWNARLGADDE